MASLDVICAALRVEGGSVADVAIGGYEGDDFANVLGDLLNGGDAYPVGAVDIELG